MPQELLLHGLIPAVRHEQTLNILAGVCGCSPTAINEQVLLFKPVRRLIRRPTNVGGTQNIQDSQKSARKAQSSENISDSHYMRCVRTDEIDTSPDVLKELDREFDQFDADESVGRSEGLSNPWELLFYDLPELSKLPVTKRSMSRTDLQENDPIAAMAGRDYAYVRQFYIALHRFVHRDVVIRVQRVFLPASDDVPTTDDGIPSMNDQVLLDPSGAYVIEASICVANGGDADLMKRAENQLLGLRDTLKGVVDLRVVDRLSLDTRAR